MTLVRFLVRCARNEHECASYSMRLSVSSDCLDADRSKSERVINKEEDSFRLANYTSKLAEEIGKKALNVWIECAAKPTDKVTSCGEIIC